MLDYTSYASFFHPLLASAPYYDNCKLYHLFLQDDPTFEERCVAKGWTERMETLQMDPPCHGVLLLQCPTIPIVKNIDDSTPSILQDPLGWESHYHPILLAPWEDESLRKQVDIPIR